MIGGQKVWPGYLTLGKIRIDFRKKYNNGAIITIAHLPDLGGSEDVRNTAAYRAKKRALYHRCWEMILHPLKAVWEK
jgi:hypothetical protein